ncbi:hypothetical protein F5Y14DRAFT_457853 [Nemania sp. NC0429]|nr:hypothetical protein F5Y14DRAFT_457853 [Nemania sp. NC0429]
MSFNYPSSSQGNAPMDMSDPTYMSNYQSSTNSAVEVRPPQQPLVPSASPLPAQLPAPPLPLPAYPSLPAAHSPLARRREYLSRALKPRRSHSTPNVTPQGMNEPDAEFHGLAGEKKRNRLGYARTNMACGNCRKRKIRCQPVKNDGRCSQCIRLKKDCQFYAVDQQPPPPSVMGAASRSHNKTMLASAATAAPVSPDQPGQMQTHQSYHGRTIPGGHNMGASHVRPESRLGNPKIAPGAPGASSYGYGQNTDNWAGVPIGPVAKQGAASASSWRSYPPQSPISPGYAPYSATASQASATWATSPLEATVGQEVPSRSEDAWSPYQQPTRAMSFGSEQHSVQYAPAANRAYDRRGSVASDMYHATSIEAIPSNPYTAWQQPYQPWYAEGGQPASPSGDENPAQIHDAYYGR